MQLLLVALFYIIILVDLNFTRPLVPFDCDKMGGCGKGTKRVPKKSCAIDPNIMGPSYNWRWKHE